MTGAKIRLGITVLLLTSWETLGQDNFVSKTRFRSFAQWEQRPLVAEQSERAEVT